jgi:hypothetical protein
MIELSSRTDAVATVQVDMQIDAFVGGKEKPKIQKRTYVLAIDKASVK